jgi:hypothetical protein
MNDADELISGIGIIIKSKYRIKKKYRRTKKNY